MKSLALLPAFELSRLYKARKVSPVEAVRAALARIDAVNPALNAFQYIDAPGAMKAARASERRWRGGNPLSALDGVPVTIKDLVYTRGMPTRFGSAATSDAGPWTEEAPAAARLREAGAVNLGKTTSPEYGWKGVTDSRLFGVTHNPWKLDRTPGGSSGGGAVATATGMGALALGTDGAGSVRIPSSFTGIFGLKPTFGRVAIYPPTSQGTLSHAGPMTRTVRDAAMMMNVIARPDIRDWYSIASDREDYLRNLNASVKGLKIALSPTLGFVERSRISADVARAVEAAAHVFEKLGARVREDEPDLNGMDPRSILNIHWQANVAVLVKAFSTEQRALMDPGLLKAAELGAWHSTETVLRAQQQRVALGVIFNEFLTRHDLLLTPTMPMTAFEVGRPAAWGGDGVDIGWTPFTLTFNLTRQPAATFPCGFDGKGLPIGLQIVAGHYRDSLVLRAAYALERKMGPLRLPEV